MQDKLKNALEALQKNGFETIYFFTAKEATNWLLESAKVGEMVTFGGSVTLTDLKLREKFEEKGVNYLDYRKEGTPKEQKEWFRQCFFCDAYYSSANAITEDGYIYNVDGRGNRVAATSYGPDRVYIVAGQNKICKDLAEAEKRRGNIAAPLNSKRLNTKTPCKETGVCSNCQSEGRICRIYTVFKHPPLGTEMTIVLVGEDLGY